MPVLGIATNSFSTMHPMTTCGAVNGTTQSEIISFGFLATGLRITNTCTDPLFVNLLEAAATTNSAFIAGCGTLTIDGSIKTSGIGLLTTSTSTVGALPAARPQISILAWSA